MRWPRSALCGGVAIALSILASCGWNTASTDRAVDHDAPEIVHVPRDTETISGAVETVAPGGLVLIAPGTYHESVTVDRPDITIRGTDRNKVVIDGERQRPFGVVVVAHCIPVENHTVTAHTFYGVLVTGLHDADGPAAHGLDGYETFDPEEFPPLERFSIDHVTAYNNGLYGIYAFNAHSGIIRDSYASGSADSGIYVGQCRECKIVIERNVAESNAIGFENANASDSVYIVGNRFSGNRVGMTLTSNYQEAFTPQRGNIVAGNVISDNAEPDSPAHAEGGFGIGVGIAGGRENVLIANRIEGNPVAGLVVRNTEDLAAVANVIRDDVFGGNGVDIANIAADRAPSQATCVSGSGFESVLPTLDDGLPWFDTEGCDAAAEITGDLPAQPAASLADLPAVTAPTGVSFTEVAPPRAQPSMDSTGAAPTPLPDAPELPDVAVAKVPDEDWLIDRARVVP